MTAAERTETVETSSVLVELAWRVTDGEEVVVTTDETSTRTDDREAAEATTAVGVADTASTDTSGNKGSTTATVDEKRESEQYDVSISNGVESKEETFNSGICARANERALALVTGKTKQATRLSE